MLQWRGGAWSKPFYYKNCNSWAIKNLETKKQALSVPSAASKTKKMESTVHCLAVFCSLAIGFEVENLRQAESLSPKKRAKR